MPGLNLGPGAVAAGVGGAPGIVEVPDSGASGAKAAAKISTAAAPTTGASPPGAPTGTPSDGGPAVAGAGSFCASTILGAEQMTATAKNAAAAVTSANDVAVRRGDLFLCVLSIISILCCS